MSEIIGNTAGEIWQFLNKNGKTTVAKMIKELKIDEKSIHRAIGWLAQENKINIEIIDRAETISLK